MADNTAASKHIQDPQEIQIDAVNFFNDIVEKITADRNALILPNEALGIPKDLLLRLPSAGSNAKEYAEIRNQIEGYANKARVYARALEGAGRTGDDPLSQAAKICLDSYREVLERKGEKGFEAGLKHCIAELKAIEFVENIGSKSLYENLGIQDRFKANRAASLVGDAVAYGPSSSLIENLLTGHLTELLESSRAERYGDKIQALRNAANEIANEVELPSGQRVFRVDEEKLRTYEENLAASLDSDIRGRADEIRDARTKKAAAQENTEIIQNAVNRVNETPQGHALSAFGYLGLPYPSTIDEVQDRWSEINAAFEAEAPLTKEQQSAYAKLTEAYQALSTPNAMERYLNEQREIIEYFISNALEGDEKAKKGVPLALYQCLGITELPDPKDSKAILAWEPPSETELTNACNVAMSYITSDLARESVDYSTRDAASKAVQDAYDVLGNSAKRDKYVADNTGKVGADALAEDIEKSGRGLGPLQRFLNRINQSKFVKNFLAATWNTPKYMQWIGIAKTCFYVAGALAIAGATIPIWGSLGWGAGVLWVMFPTWFVGVGMLQKGGMKSLETFARLISLYKNKFEDSLAALQAQPDDPERTTVGFQRFFGQLIDECGLDPQTLFTIKKKLREINEIYDREMAPGGRFVSMSEATKKVDELKRFFIRNPISTSFNPQVVHLGRTEEFIKQEESMLAELDELNSKKSLKYEMWYNQVAEIAKDEKKLKERTGGKHGTSSEWADLERRKNDASALLREYQGLDNQYEETLQYMMQGQGAIAKNVSYVLVQALLLQEKLQKYRQLKRGGEIEGFIAMEQAKRAMQTDLDQFIRYLGPKEVEILGRKQRVGSVSEELGARKYFPMKLLAEGGARIQRIPNNYLIPSAA